LTLVGLCAATILRAQQPEVRVSSRTYTPPPPYALRVESRLVETGVVVRDQEGRAIAGLNKGDFKILDDGKEREITAFAVETSSRAGPPPALPPSAPSAVVDPPRVPARPPAAAKPRYVALLFDDVSTRQGDLSRTRLAAVRFVKEGLRPGDRAGIFTTSETAVIGFTAEKPNLIEAIEKLQAHPRMSEDGVMPCPRITPYQAYLIINLDLPALQAAIDEANSCAEAIPQPPTILPNAASGGLTMQLVRAQAEQTWDQARIISQFTLDEIQHVVDILAKLPGQRVLLLASSGFLAGTLEYEQNRIIDRALAAGVVINALDAKGLFADTPVRTPDQLMYLTALPTSTAVFEATTLGSQLQELISPLSYLAQSTGGLFFHDSNDLNLGFQELAAVPEVTYLLGFRPGEIREGRYRKLSVKFLRKGYYTVQARRGYFAAKAQPPAPHPRQKLDQEVMADDVLAGFPATVTAEPGTSPDGHPLVWVAVHVDLRKLTFTNKVAHHLQRLTFVAALLDAQGKLVTTKEGRMDFELTEATYARLIESGVNAKLALEAAPEHTGCGKWPPRP
jgi:VWFA-related protein